MKEVEEYGEVATMEVGDVYGEGERFMEWKSYCWVGLNTQIRSESESSPLLGWEHQVVDHGVMYIG